MKTTARKTEFFRRIFKLLPLILIIGVGMYLRFERFPYLPKFTDEVREALVAYDIYTLKSFPLTNFTHYIGPIYVYLLAIFMWIFPISIWIPRYLIGIFGVILLPIIYIFIKRHYGKKIAILTTLYVSLSPTLFLINSRVGWSNCLTPFAVILILFGIDRYLKNRNSKNLFFVFLLGGLTIQLHPLMSLFVLPLIGFAIIGTFRKRFINKVLIAFFGLLLGMLPFVISNIKDPGIYFADASQREHLSEGGFTLQAYKANLRDEYAQTRHLLRQAIVIDDYVEPSYEYYSAFALRSVADIIVILFILGIVRTFRKRDRLGLILLGATGFFLLVTPVINDSYFEGMKIRYYSHLIPIFGLFVSLGALFISEFFKRDFIRYLIVLFAIGVLTYVPLSNYRNYRQSLLYLNPIHAVKSEVESLREKSQNTKIYYVDPAFRDNGKQYSVVEYYLKFSGANLNNIQAINDVYPKSGGILVLPDVESYGMEEPFSLHIIKHKARKYRQEPQTDDLKEIFDGIYVDIYEWVPNN